MNLFIFVVSTVVFAASVVIVAKAVAGVFSHAARKWTARCQRKEDSKAKAQAEARESAEELARFKELAEAKARALSEKALNPVFTEGRDWSEFDTAAFIRKGKVFIF